MLKRLLFCRYACIIIYNREKEGMVYKNEKKVYYDSHGAFGDHVAACRLFAG